MLLPALPLLAQEKVSFEPTSSYTNLKVEGFTIKLSRAAKNDHEDLDLAMPLLKLRFQEIVKHAPPQAVEKLRLIPIWVEKNDEKIPCMCYHPDAGWLKDNGLNPDKVKGVELANLKNFVLWSYDQPMMVFHEYAHGFHDTVYGFENAEILAAFNSAQKAHLYDKVNYYRGQSIKAYAATNQMEYFAELSEATFGYNDFFPFTKPELEKYDPEGAKVVSDAWNLKIPKT